MIHHRQRLPFGFEAGDHLPCVHPRLDDLEGHSAADGLGLLRHENDAEAPFANLLQDFVRAYLRAGAFGNQLVDGGRTVHDRLFQELLGLGLGAFVELDDGETYIEFLTPGLLALFPMFATVFECAWGSYVRMEMQHTYHAMVVTPVSLDDVIAGEILSGTTRAVITATSILVVATVLTPIYHMIDSPWAVLIPVWMIVPGVMFSALSISYASIPASDLDSFITDLMLDDTEVIVKKEKLADGFVVIHHNKTKGLVYANTMKIKGEHHLECRASQAKDGGVPNPDKTMAWLESICMSLEIE